MKLLILTSRFPYPIEKGDKLRIYHQIRYLSQKYEVCLVSICDHELREEDKAHLLQFCAQIHIFNISKPDILWNLCKGIFSSWPFQVHYFYRKKFHKQILQIVEEFNPTCIYCQLIRMAPYVQGLEAAKTLDYMDCFSKGMERRYVVSKGLKKLFRWEANKLASYEEAIFPLFNSHSIISEQDKELLPGANTDRIMVIPNGVDTRYFTGKRGVNQMFDLLFVGNMGYAPNVFAARYLALQILPEIRKIRPGTTLLLAGARPGKNVQELEQEAGVTVGGWFEDIRTAYSDGKIFVAPLFSGSGQQNKILEAMAMEVPCVSTDLVNNAIKAEAEKEIMIANDLKTFVKQCLMLLEKPKTATRRGKNGRKFVKANYSWEKSMELLEELLTRSVSITK